MTLFSRSPPPFAWLVLRRIAGKLFFHSKADNVTPVSCMMYGQPELAKWTEGHPNWRVRRFTCRLAGTFAKL